jgi:TPR repeat protein
MTKARQPGRRSGWREAFAALTAGLALAMTAGASPTAAQAARSDIRTASVASLIAGCSNHSWVEWQTGRVEVCEAVLDKVSRDGATASNRTAANQAIGHLIYGCRAWTYDTWGGVREHVCSAALNAVSRDDAMATDQTAALEALRQACNDGKACRDVRVLACALGQRGIENGDACLASLRALLNMNHYGSDWAFGRACNAGNMFGCVGAGFRLDYPYANGREAMPPQDPARARALFQRACDNGNVAGCRELGQRLFEADPPRALAALRQACTGGSGTACFMIANFNLETNLPSVSFEERVSAMARACELGMNGNACTEFASLRGDDHCSWGASNQRAQERSRCGNPSAERTAEQAAARAIVTDRQAFNIYDRACALGDDTDARRSSVDVGTIDSGWACYYLSKFYRIDWPRAPRVVPADRERYQALRRRACQIGAWDMSVECELSNLAAQQ